MLAQVEFASTMLEIGMVFSKASAHVVKDYLPIRPSTCR